MKPAEKSLLSSVSKSQKTVLLGNSVCTYVATQFEKIEHFAQKKNALNLRPNQPPLNFVFPKMRLICDQVNAL